MDDRELLSLWRRADEPMPGDSYDVEEIQHWLQKSARSADRGLGFTLGFHAVGQVGVTALACLNAVLLPGTAWTHLLSSLTAVVASVGLTWTLVVWRSWRLIRRMDGPIVATQHHKVRFVESVYRAWLGVAALTPGLFTIAVLVRVDTLEGGFTIHNPALFIGLLAAMTMAGWGSTKMVTERAIGALRAELLVLDDDAEILDARRREAKRARNLVLLAVLILVAAVTMTVVLYQRN